MNQGEKGDMMTSHSMKRAVLLLAVVAMLAIPALTASGVGSEVGLGVPISTSFSFTSFSYGLEAYYRLAGAVLAWETALRTNMSFTSLYIRNTLATAAALHLCLGHVTNLLPYFGSTYFTAGVGLTFGRAIIVRMAFNIAMSIGGGSVYFFPEILFQFGLRP
jgi:hypothetical protein